MCKIKLRMHPMSFTHQQFIHFNPPQVAALWSVSSRRSLSIRKREMECLTITAAAASFFNSGDLSADATSSSSAKGSGTTARGRRLLKVREEKRKREYERLHNYPAWAKSFSFSLDFILFYVTWIPNISFCFFRVLEDACKHDTELRAVLGDSIGNPELMRKRVGAILSFSKYSTFY